MTAQRLILVANDNRPTPHRAEPAAERASVPVHPPQNMRPVEAKPTPKRPDPKSRPSDIGRWTALLYQLSASALLIFAIFRGLDPVAVAGIAVLSSLGGVCALAGWDPKGFFGRIGRALSAMGAALSATFALILLIPSDVMSGLQNPLLLASLVFAAFGTIFRLRTSLLVALSGLLLLLAQESLLTLPLTTAIQVGCILALCALGAYRARSGLILATLAIFSLGLLWLSLTETSVHSVQALGAIGIAGAALWAVGLLNRTRLGDLEIPGLIVTLGASLAAQFALMDAAIADTFLQPSAQQLHLAVLLVAAQGLVLMVQICRWLSGQIGWLGILLPQLVLAAVAMVVIDPTALERLIVIPASVDMPSLYALSLGAIVGAIALFGLWESWCADRPVRTASFALALIAQFGLTWRLSSHSLDLAVLAGIGFAGAISAVLLCRRLNAHKRYLGDKTTENTDTQPVHSFQAQY